MLHIRFNQLMFTKMCLLYDLCSDKYIQEKGKAVKKMYVCMYGWMDIALKQDFMTSSGPLSSLINL